MENDSKIKTLQICRTCMQEIMDTSVFFLLDSTQTNTEPTIREKLSDCIPELDLHITPNAVICNKCVDMINIMHKFKNGCLRSEMQIHQYIQQVQHSGDVIDLIDIAQFHQLCIRFKRELHEITEDFEIKDFKNDLTTSICDVNAVKEEDDVTEIVKQEYAFNYSTSTAEDTLDKYNIPDFHEIAEDFEIKDFQNEDLTTAVCNANAVKEIDEDTEIVKQDYTSNYSISLVEDTLDKYNKSNSVQNCLPQVVDDQNDKIKKLCKNDVYYECFTCGFKAKSKFKLILHLKTHISKKLFQCSICEYSCSQNGHLKWHMCIHTGEKPLKCSICEYSCITKSKLKRHMRIHTGEKPFKCFICEYSCTEKGNLKRHMRLHTGEKPFKCSICKYSCIQKGNLQIHMRAHTGEKPFKCSICECSFTQKKYLKHHIMQIHNGGKNF